MALPKKFNQIDKRVEALNEIKFYTISFDVKLTENFVKQQIESYDWGSENKYWGVPHDYDIESIRKIKKLSALNDEEATRKITEWLDSEIKKKHISTYKILDVKSNNFLEELKIF